MVANIVTFIGKQSWPIYIHNTTIGNEPPSTENLSITNIPIDWNVNITYNHCESRSNTSTFIVAFVFWIRMDIAAKYAMFVYYSILSEGCVPHWNHKNTIGKHRRLERYNIFDTMNIVIGICLCLRTTYSSNRHLHIGCNIVEWNIACWLILENK